ncbi:conserved hypothetical protein [Flavobacterium psychrophilum]|uniref:hypothetical protein n=1 Tax=Flavobacterium psychrophilum TaxID=96345 RepID=UPI000B7C2915|nr:hypothetical protein [Flavobacterium psychrophilum]GEJ38047.1 hypothetical protein FPN184_contig00064-0011 [Flavobacterium psychrophilum]GEJ50171.1 hypothetical protein FPKKA176_contig00063-0017 [Flavobacterium psychrophilum]SNB05422.1 conserved hypothetical protein [Flavobacterium psychrophilum]
MQDLIKNILSDLRVDLTDEFDKNFERKSFFGKSWENTAIPNKRGSVMMRTGKLRRSIQCKQTKNQITWSSSLPYASLQNQGGEIIVTEKMKRFFLAMFYKSSNAILFNVRSKAAAKTERNRRLSAEALMWKNLALQKVGAKMKIKQRQFIGDHPQVRQRIEHVVNKNMEEIGKTIFNKFKQ